jgi:AcrR family transcriptional regulator
VARTSRTQTRHTETRAGEQAAVLRAAERVFARAGFEDAKMQDIASEAHVSLRSVYAIARGKSELYQLVNHRRARDLLSHIQAAVSSEESAVDALRDVIEAIATFLMEHSDFLRIHLRESGTWALEESARVSLVDERHESDHKLESLFRRGIRDESFHSENPRLMVASLRALMQVHLAAWLASSRRAKRATVESMTRQAERHFVR